jgi:hypothetical protein
MKKIITLIMLSFSSFILAQSPPGDLNLSPSSLKLKVYKFAVSTATNCSNPQTIVDNGNSPVETNFLSHPSLGSGHLTDGTYPCIIIEVSDNIKYIPATNSTTGNCLTSVESVLDVCRGGDTSTLIDGSTTTCAVRDDRVALYISTMSNNSGGTAFIAPSVGTPGNGINLTSPLVVSGEIVGKFIVNPSGKVCDDGADTTAACDGGGSSNQCRLEPPTFTFSTL